MYASSCSPRWLFHVSARRLNPRRYRVQSRLTFSNVQPAPLPWYSQPRILVHLQSFVHSNSTITLSPIIGQVLCLSDACKFPPGSMSVSSNSWLVEISISSPTKCINEYSEIASPQHPFV